MDGRALAAAVSTRQREVVAALRAPDESALLGPSRLPGWDRLTIACHLRYGAAASERLTRAALDGEPAAFYPEGRDRQRPATLQPEPGESVAQVVAGLATTSRRLDDRWSPLGPDEWSSTVTEPEANPDLGPVVLSMLALLRLTEVEVHGSDLDLGLAPWSTTFVETALPVRLAWLATRRSNHREADRSIEGTWVLAASDGPTFRISTAGDDVTVEQGSTAGAQAVLAGTGAELLAFILGRRSVEILEIAGDRHFAQGFLAAFPAP